MDSKTVFIIPLLLGASDKIAASSVQQPPNIIIIMADQLRADLMQREGYPLNTMPVIDSLAQTGTWFNKAYTSAPASGPARVSMLTGRYPHATHVRTNHNIEDAFFTKDLFDIAHQQGYRTALIGKNHSYLTAEKVDYWSSYEHNGQSGNNKSKRSTQYDAYLDRLNMYSNLNCTPFEVECQLPYRMVDDASTWISTLSNHPFLMWFSIPEPHNPYQVCEPYYSMFPPEILPAMKSSANDRSLKGEEYELLAEMMGKGHVGYEMNISRLRSIYHGMLRMIDDQIGRLVYKLKEQGVFDNTIIVFVADHGDYVGEYGLMKKGVGMDEVLVRIPMQWSGPGIQASKLPGSAHVSIIDIFPTICEIMKAQIPDGVQGRSLWPLLQGQAYPEKEFSSIMVEDGYGGMYYTKKDGTDYMNEGAVSSTAGYFDELNTWSQSGTMRMVRKGEWKLVYDMDGNGQLYNLSNDPVELCNLFGDEEYENIKNELLKSLLRWELSTQDPLPLPRYRYRFKRNEHNYIFSNQ